MKATLLALSSVLLMGCGHLPTAERGHSSAVMTGPQTASQEFTYQGKRYRLAAEWKVRSARSAAAGESPVIACETSARVLLLPTNGGAERVISPVSRAHRGFTVHYFPEVEDGVLKMSEGNASDTGGGSGINDYILRAEVAVEPQSNGTTKGEMPVYARARLSVEDARASGAPALTGMTITTSWLAKPDEQGRVQLLPRGTTVR